MAYMAGDFEHDGTEVRIIIQTRGGANVVTAAEAIGRVKAKAFPLARLATKEPLKINVAKLPFTQAQVDALVAAVVAQVVKETNEPKAEGSGVDI